MDKRRKVAKSRIVSSCISTKEVKLRKAGLYPLVYRQKKKSCEKQDCILLCIDRVGRAALGRRRRLTGHPSRHATLCIIRPAIEPKVQNMKIHMFCFSHSVNAWVKLDYRSHTVPLLFCRQTVPQNLKKKNRKVYYIQNKLIHVS